MTRWAAPALLAALLSFSACAGGSDGGSGDSSGETSFTSDESGANAEADETAPESAAPDGGAQKVAGSDTGDDEAPDPGASIINTGSVSLSSGDVEKTRFDAQKVIDAHKGQIADENTQTDTDGEMRTSRLVLRVPSADFDAVMTELGEVARLSESTRSSEDVTTQMIDNEVRVRAQEKSLRRVEVLLARASTINEIVSIEAQLTTRQAELDSLKRRQAWLKDQTSLSTVTLYIAHDDEAPAPDKEEDRNAFIAGLLDGWDALKGIGAGLAQVAGALLPFAVVAGVLGVPVAVLLRRLRSRGRPAPTPEAV